MLGNALKELKVPRESVIIATKVRGMMSEGMNDVGLSRHHIMNSVEQSLKRLQVEYIDLYQIHGFDPLTPLEETMQALNDLVRSGKVRYIGASNLAAWQLAKANNIARMHGWAEFITFQGYYSLVGRGIENEVIPYCADNNMGILAWSPLAGGLLTGKYRKDNSSGRLAGEMKNFIPYNEETLARVFSQLEVISKAHSASFADVALAWVREKHHVSSVIIGARNIEQLQDNLRAGDLILTAQEMKALDDASLEQLPYPQWMIKFQCRDRSEGNL